MSRVWLALRAIVYAALFLTLWTGVALMCRTLDKYIPLAVPGAARIPGLVLILAGTALDITTVCFFVLEGRGTPALFDPPRKFVPHGPYRFMRNPMYLGYVTVLVGLGFWLKSVAMVLFAVVALLVIHAFVVLVEEPGLHKRFGEEYVDYCRAVPRWIPCFTPQHLPE
jgi:protein-S-isoprenylcysteine O-methyltransferase Ste14